MQSRPIPLRQHFYCHGSPSGSKEPFGEPGECWNGCESNNIKTRDGDGAAVNVGQVIIGH